VIHQSQAQVYYLKNQSLSVLGRNSYLLVLVVLKALEKNLFFKKVLLLFSNFVTQLFRLYYIKNQSLSVLGRNSYLLIRVLVGEIKKNFFVKV
jgi:hypothetical protein